MDVKPKSTFWNIDFPIVNDWSMLILVSNTLETMSVICLVCFVILYPVNRKSRIDYVTYCAVWNIAIVFHK